MQDKKIKKALLKCATGLKSREIVEEFTVEGGELKLVKRKVTNREIPPDIKAVKLIMDGESEYVSDETLEDEKQELLKMLKEKNYD